jgi:hypothetical protein
MINNTNNKSVHFPITPQVIKYNYYVPGAHIFDFNVIVLHLQGLAFGVEVSSAKYTMFSWLSTL